MSNKLKKVGYLSFSIVSEREKDNRREVLIENY
jgi:hypothetical protein